MKINLTILVLLILATASWTFYANQSSPFLPNAPITRSDQELAPDFTYTTLDGQISSLYAHKGKVVFVHFWASWCAPCIVEFPELIELAKNQKDNLILLAISIDESESDIQKFVKSLKKDLPKNLYLIQDKEEILSKGLYKTSKLPETYIISGGSTFIEKVIGPQDRWNTAGWRHKISRESSE